jgi:signal transduction histidine kinase
MLALTGLRELLTNQGLIQLEVRRRTVHGRECCEFQVKDTGIGMTQEQMERLFKPFTQADASTTRKYGGTGLGLAIVWRFCQMMGGKISVESTLGGGSLFTVHLPVEVSSQPGEEAIAAELWEMY